MLSLKPNSLLYEINARTFQRHINRKYGSTFTLATIPDAEWDSIRDSGFNAIWLMGIWQQSPAAKKQALQNSNLRREYDRLLPGWTEKEIAASAYAIYNYSVDSEFGDATDLPRLKAKLNSRELSLILDFVPNHVAIDHPWTILHPEWFIQGSSKDIKAHPDWFFSPDGINYLAHGRDPNFPSWTDTAQLNYYSMDLRQTLIQELLKIAEVADGVRCDMAMLVLNDIFDMVWGNIVRGKMPQTEFWAKAISTVKQKFPEFIFIAEAYWGRDKELQELGFDYMYDKTLYDKLRYTSAPEILGYISSRGANIVRSVHFIENHDEPRAISIFGKAKSMAAVVAIVTLPGIRMLFNGQLQGKAIHIPIQLATEIEEAGDIDITRFYRRLLDICNQPAFHGGTWELLTTIEAWDGNLSYQNLMAWCWQYNTKLKVVVTNYAPDDSQGRVILQSLPRELIRVLSRDELDEALYECHVDEVNNQGLYIALKPWQSHILDLTLGL